MKSRHFHRIAYGLFCFAVLVVIVAARPAGGGKITSDSEDTSNADHDRAAKKRRADQLLRGTSDALDIGGPVFSADLAEARRLYRELGLIEDVAKTLRESLRGGGRDLESARELIDIDNRLPPPPKQRAIDEVLIASAFYAARQFDDAFDHIHQAFVHARESGSTDALARCYQIAGRVHSFRGEITLAIDDWREAARLFEQVGDRVSQAAALREFGGWLFEAGNHEEAFGAMERCVETARAADTKIDTVRDWRRNRQTIGEAHATLAGIYRRFGRPREALALYYRARQELIKANTSDQRIVLLTDMAEIYAELGNDARAELYYEFAVLRDPGGDGWLNSRSTVGYGSYLERKGRPSDALVLFQESRDVAQKHGLGTVEAESLIRMGWAHLMLSQRDQALSSFDEALRLVQTRVLRPSLHWRTHHGRGRALAELGRNEEAVKEYETAIRLIEQWLRGVPRSPDNPATTEMSLWEPYHDALIAYWRGGSIERAFQLAEQAKMGLLALASHKLGSPRSLTREERVNEARLRGTITNLRYRLFTDSSRGNDADTEQARSILSSQLERALGEYDVFQTELRRKHSNLSLTHGIPSIVSLNEAMTLARDSGAVIINYVVTEDCILAFVINPNSVRAVQLPASVSDIRRAVAELVNLYRIEPRRSPRMSPKPAASIYLYTNLIAPLDLESDVDMVCIIPDGDLWSVPFEMLVHNGRFLIERFPVFYAPSMSVLRMLTDRQKANGNGYRRVAAVGNPDMGGSHERTDAFRGTFPQRLAAEELNSMKSIFGDKTDIYEGARAKESAGRFVLEHYDLVHFACHGIYIDAYPMLSALVMTRDPAAANDDGFLEAREIATLDIKAKLVVLAACDMARGLVARGQGLIGMTWATFVGGAGGCLAARWRVSDRATGRLSEAFYRYISRGFTNAESLRKAQLELLHSKEYSNPFHWAGFLLMGK